MPINVFIKCFEYVREIYIISMVSDSRHLRLDVQQKFLMIILGVDGLLKVPTLMNFNAIFQNWLELRFDNNSNNRNNSNNKNKIAVATITFATITVKCLRYFNTCFGWKEHIFINDCWQTIITVLTNCGKSDRCYEMYKKIDIRN